MSKEKIERCRQALSLIEEKCRNWEEPIDRFIWDAEIHALRWSVDTAERTINPTAAQRRKRESAQHESDQTSDSAPVA
jgi:hypothetical protein